MHTDGILLTKHGSSRLDEVYMSLAVCGLIGYNSIALFVNTIFNSFIVHTSYDSMFMSGLLLLIVLRAMFIVIQKIKLDMIVILALFVLLWCLSYTFFTDNRSMLLSNWTFNLFVLSLPCYYLIRAVTDFTLLKKYLKVLSYMIIICAILTYIVNVFIENVIVEYMSFSNYMLPGVIYAIYLAMSERKIHHIILALAGFLLTVISGARGPLLCMFVFVILYIFATRQMKSIAKILIVSFLAVSAIFILSYYNPILKYISGHLGIFAYTSRTLDMLVDGDIFSLSGRDTIFNADVQAINKNPLTGYGIFGDRVVNQNSFLQKSIYPHNIILEIWMNYGVLFGSIFIIVFLGIVFYGLFRGKNELRRDLVCVFIPVGLIKLLTSGSYLEEPFFFFLLGMAINSISYKPILLHNDTPNKFVLSWNRPRENQI